ncbi:VCBS repeat-containing protein [Maribacter sp. ACAM166]|uniref:VCBS repeat-containing protein n=1 Tax=Maribacter sp. ACAM166 TaxID=2508996 RepID=UPI001485A24C|nr:VCBS repeat-containing protein [Maribacter sp. ACAM166]
MRIILRTLLLLLLIIAAGCITEGKDDELKIQGFSEINAKKSSIFFGNNITISDTLNYNTFPYIYMGGGVALGDVNNDNLTDVFLTGNMVPNALYLNRGGMTFEDISIDADIAGDSRWYTGVTMVDINTDGWLDIYVSVSGLGGNTHNQLFINNGPSTDTGQVTFTEMAAEYGIADKSNSIQSTFFDSDNDGDLDLYVGNYPTIPLTMPNTYYFDKMQQRNLVESGHLFRNDGNGRFTDITEQAGVLNFGLSLGVVASDFNNDGWKDLYVSNDFNVPDYLYMNNGDGTFSERIKETSRQTSMFGMGVDAADFNNDGLMDLVQVDMTPNDHYRSKTNMASMDPQSFYGMVSMGFHFQYMQNSIQVNNGITNDGRPIFSNVARLTGIATTDWSWAPLFADFDNDGLKDIVITNGMRLDVNNNDLLTRENSTSIVPEKIDMNQAPSTPIQNFVFRNKGDYEFEDVSKKWNINSKGFSNGIAYGDLDNDGDLDMVINNIDQEASLLHNNNHGANFLRLKLHGNEQNPMGLGSKIKLSSGTSVQWIEHTLSRGFLSSIEPIVHFGLGKENMVNRIDVFWPDGKVETLKNVTVNQTLDIHYLNSEDKKVEQEKGTFAFTDVTKESGLHFTHTEDLYNDFLIEPLLPHKNSELGPALAVKDINNDGLDDFFIGNAKNEKGGLFLQNASGSFNEMDGPWSEDQSFEDTGAVFFDADADGDQDLYVISGGNHVSSNIDFYQDRLYVNTQYGFIKSKESLPEINTSGLKVAPVDYDGDGDMDIFVGGRIQPGRYLQPPRSYLLENIGGSDSTLRFVDVTSRVAPELQNIGLVTDALWCDFNADGKQDLILTGEWMPITFFENDGNRFNDVTEKMDFQNTVGWWYSLETADLDNDGDLDIVAGNLGLNSKHKSTEESPFEIYVNDFDENNRQDIVLSITKEGVKLPVRGRQCSSEQIPMIKRNFETYASFASANLIDIYGKKMLESSIHKKADTFAHHWFENNGDGTYEKHQLPIESQFSSINDIVIFDYNNDDFPDLLVAGNLYDTEVETPRVDAGIGLVLQNDGKKGFDAILMNKSGLLLDNEVKAMAAIKLGELHKSGFIVAINNDTPKLISFKKVMIKNDSIKLKELAVSLKKNQLK